MRNLFAVTTLLVLGLATGAASAQHDHDRRGVQEHHGHHPHHPHHDHHGADRKEIRGHNDRHGYDYRHGLRRGDRLPYEYRSRQYVVEEWRRHRLSAPPRGHRWVQIGAQYVLVTVPTGIVANVIFMR